MKSLLTLFALIGCSIAFSQPIQRHQCEIITEKGYAAIVDSKIDGDGNLIHVGWYYDTVVSQRYSYMLKTDLSGNLLWNMKLGSTSSDLPIRVIVAANGDYLVLCKSLRSTVVRISKNGSLIWWKLYYPYLGGAVGSEAGGLTELPNGDIAICYHNDDDKNSTYVQNEGYITMLDSAGEIKWGKKYGYTQSWNNDEYIFNDIAFYNNRLYVAGKTSNQSIYGGEAMLMELDTSGNILKIRRFGNIVNTNGKNFRHYSLNDITVRDGKLFLNGVTDTITNYFPSYQLVAVLDTGSAVVKAKILKTPASLYSRSKLFIKDTNDFYVVLRPFNSASTEYNSVFVARLTNGSLAWVKKETVNNLLVSINSVNVLEDTVVMTGRKPRSAFLSRFTATLPTAQLYGG